MPFSPLLAELDPAAFGGHVDDIVASLSYFSTEFQVVAGALLILLLDLCLPLRYSKHLAWVAIGVCVYPATSLFGGHHVEPESSRLFLGMVSHDDFSRFFQLFFLLGSVPLIFLTYISSGLENRRMGEYYALLLASVFGAMLMASSTHFLMLFLALELVSFASYVLVGYRRRDRKGVEASLKYIIYGSVASGVMAFGISLYYGLTGSADVADLAGVVRAETLAEGDASALSVMALLSLLLIFVGIAYKISSIPMHFWAPDAYEGAPTPVTAFLSVLSKAAGFALALRFFGSLVHSVHGLEDGHLAKGVWESILGSLESGAHSPWLLIVCVVSIATMTIGNLAALGQTNLKRLFAYSSIAHAGYMMMGLTLLSPEARTDVGGIEAISFYLLAYLAMNFGAFAVVILVENRTGTADIEGFQGLGRRSPLLAAAMIVFLFSLIGIPPTGGFIGKFKLFMGLVDMRQTEYYVLAIAAAINTAISAWYYLRIAREMYFSDVTPAGELRSSVLGRAVVMAMVVVTLYLFFRAEGILEHVDGLEFRL